MKLIDLHLHTVFSDGTYTPAQLIAEAHKAGLCAISVVDHDTTAGIEPVLEVAGKLGIELVTGIELTAAYEGTEIHILGYLIDHKNKLLLEKLASLRQIRIERIHKIVKKLNEAGVEIDAQSIFDISGPGTVGRLHVARALVRSGIAKSIFEAFQKYIGDKCPAYVLGFKLTPREAMKLIRDSGGIPILAHPYTLSNDGLIPEFIDSGLMGLEVYYPEHSQGMINSYLRIAKKYNLLVTGGSDCHGDAKPQVKIGSVKVPYELVDKLKEAKLRDCR